jgi:LPXTG-motif cell wall-anchored protein
VVSNTAGVFGLFAIIGAVVFFRRRNNI